MGPYYLTTLVQLLGPARSISASARISRAQRPILSEPLRGQLIDVEVPTHVGTLVEFASGPIASLVTSFDVQATRYHNIEVYGTEATLSVPNPNTFDGPVRIKRPGDEAWTELDLLSAHLPQQRGIGFADMCWAGRTGRAHRASSALALHVLELMTGALAAAETGRRVDLATTCDRAAPLPTGLAPNTFDD
jgi:predicted dehydrogenase